MMLSKIVSALSPTLLTLVVLTNPILGIQITGLLGVLALVLLGILALIYRRRLWSTS
jgi:hypothetical protein